MAYYLTVSVKDKKSKILMIDQSKKFMRLNNYKKSGACSLEEIDLFTTTFYDEEDLKNSLCFEGILSLDDYPKKITIKKRKGEGMQKVPYDLLYQKDAKYLVSPKLLIDEIEQRTDNNDFEFILALARKFQNYYDCNQTASDIVDCATYSINVNKRSGYFDLYDEQDDRLVRRFLNLLIYRYRQLPDCKIIYDNTIKYANLHHIIAFMNNYDKEKKKEILNTDKSSLYDSGDYTKKKSRDIIDGQLSLF